MVTEGTQGGFESARDSQIVALLFDLQPHLVIYSVDMKIVEILALISSPIEQQQTSLMKDHDSILPMGWNVALQLLPLPVETLQV